ncbi:hypothetical protein Golob_023865 [Gossypium lobatum]|uniref:DUF7745 domain-containing protein n=1 Tax=Gossypium lobatum TaxID=34289 RepID=A0A7J8NII5_9ROSI|nr:hypothetical protein [Gossypium lobatum]
MAHPDTKKKLDVFALSIYGLVIFPKALGRIDEAVTDLFDQLNRRVTSVPIILAETFRFLSACRRTGEGRFIGCAQLLLAWFHSHFWKIEYLEANKDRQNEQLHYIQNQVRDRDHIMGEAVAQIREVADHPQTLAVQADTPSVKYELESSRGKELASLLKKIRILIIGAKPYM